MSTDPTPRPRRGWREPVEPGIARAHRVACASTADRRPRRRCDCPFEVLVAGGGQTRTVTLTGVTLSQARAERARLTSARPAPRAQVETPGPGEPRTLHDLVVAYFRARSPVLAANTVRIRDDDYRGRIAPVLGHLPLDAVTRAAVEAWLGGLVGSGASRRAVVSAVATLRVVLQAAVDWGYLAENPARRLRLPPPGPAPARRVLDHPELARLYAGAGSLRTETMLRVGAEGGLRRGEIAGLRWPDVVLDRRRLTVVRQVVQERKPEGGHVKVVGPTKGRRARVVALSRTTSARLAEYYAEAVVVGGDDATGWVWPGAKGGPIHDRSLARALERACARAGLLDETGRPLVSPHGLRWGTGSLALDGGAPLVVVSAQLGHADPAITARLYAHLISADDLDRVAAVFDDLPALGGGPEGETADRSTGGRRGARPPSARPPYSCGVSGGLT